MQEEENIYEGMELEEAFIERKYRSCLNSLDRLAEDCRNFIYVANGYFNNTDIATKRYNDDKKLLDIYDRINRIKEDLDLIKTHFKTNKQENENKEEQIIF